MKQKCLSIIFALWILTLFLWALLLPDRAVSVAERRTLRQFPAPTVKTVLSGAWGTRLDAYFADQFPARESFRKAALGFRGDALRLSDYKGVYLAGDSLVQMVYPLKEESVRALAKRIDGICASYFPGSPGYCALIPDKGTFYGAASGHLRLDFQRMEEVLKESCQNADYVTIADLLTGEDYYRTDIHWRQECILPVAERLCAAMQSSLAAEKYEAHELYPFYGSYAARTADPQPDTLTYLTSDLLENALVDNLDKPGIRTVYDPAAFSGMDGYDVFLSGASSLITVTNTVPGESAKGRTLVLFRDSFGSAIAPLLLPGYERIVLVDLRYLSESALPGYLPMENPAATDVLFLFGAETANTKGILR